MNEKVTENFTKVVEYIKNLDKKKRNLYILILCICIFVAIITVFLLNYKEYVVLYRNLDTKECFEIVTKLDEMNIASRVENESTIYVDKKDEPKVKMQLAAEGYPKSALNYDIFTDNIDFMTTDYEKTKYDLFQLQERLQGSIKTLDNVNDAIVTITIPDNSLAVLDVDKIEPSASVILNLMRGITLDRQQIKGIEQLIARSVPGLVEENVSIVDQTGAVINGTAEDLTLASTAGRIKTENEISKIITDRITKVLEPIYGKNNISVGVNVVLDYNKKITEKTEYTPSQGNAGVVNNYEQTYEGPQSGAATGGIPGTEKNTEIPGYQIKEEDKTTNENIKNQVSVDYVVNQIKEQIQKEGAEIKDATVSILIGKKNVSEEEAAKVTAIVANTAGISKEKVEFFNAEFAASKDKGKSDADNQQKEPVMLSGFFGPKYLLLYGIILLVILSLIVLFGILRAKRKKRRQENLIVPAEEEIEDEKTDAEEITWDFSKISETKEQQLKRELKDFSDKAPHITASLLRTFLKGDLE